jgi:hypothetical protein
VFCGCSTAAEPLYSPWLFFLWLLFLGHSFFNLDHSFSTLQVPAKLDSCLHHWQYRFLDQIGGDFNLGRCGGHVPRERNPHPIWFKHHRPSEQLRKVRVAPETVETASRVILEVVLIQAYFFFWRSFSGVLFLVFLFLVFFLNPPINHDGQYDQWNLYFNVTGM